MADYNVNMKQWNGTSFDNVLPLAYNAKQLGGQSLAEVKQWVQDNNLLLYSGQYTGTGTYGESNPTTLTFPFEPILLLLPVSMNTAINFVGYQVLTTSLLNSNYNNFVVENNVGTTRGLYMKKSSDGKIISFYDAQNQEYQFNVVGHTYYYAAIGGYDMGGGN